jgi:hypothetical protein
MSSMAAILSFRRSFRRSFRLAVRRWSSRVARIVRAAGPLSLILLMPLLGATCSHGGTPMLASPRVPAAEGAVSVKDGANGATKLEVSVKHLAPADKVATGASTYVVWLRPIATDSSSEPAQNVGALAVNKKLEGEMSTVTAYRQFDVFVTAEPEPGSTAPTGEQLLTSSIRR